MDRIGRGRPVLVPGHGGWLRQFGHVEDLGRRHGGHAREPRTYGQAYNVMGEDTVTQVGFVELIADVMKKPVAPPLRRRASSRASTSPGPVFGQNLVYDCHAVHTTTSSATSWASSRATPSPPASPIPGSGTERRSSSTGRWTSPSRTRSSPRSARDTPPRPPSSSTPEPGEAPAYARLIQRRRGVVVHRLRHARREPSRDRRRRDSLRVELSRRRSCPRGGGFGGSRTWARESSAILSRAAARVQGDAGRGHLRAVDGRVHARLVPLGHPANRALPRPAARAPLGAGRPARLHGATLCVVGLGDIGRAIARAARAFGMRVVGVTPERPAGAGRERVYRTAARRRALAAADFVVLTVPLTDATRGLIGAAELAVMRPRRGSSTSRGPRVDEAALLEALRARRIGGAVLDVFDEEPLPPTIRCGSSIT